MWACEREARGSPINFPRAVITVKAHVGHGYKYFAVSPRFAERTFKRRTQEMADRTVFWIALVAVSTLLLFQGTNAQDAVSK